MTKLLNRREAAPQRAKDPKGPAFETPDKAKLAQARVADRSGDHIQASPVAVRPSRSKLTFRPTTALESKPTPSDGQVSRGEAPFTKIAQITQLLRRPEGAGIADLMAATGWQAHSIRGALSGAIKTKLKLNVVSEKAEGGRVYRIVEAAAA